MDDHFSPSSLATKTDAGNEVGTSLNVDRRGGCIKFRALVTADFCNDHYLNGLRIGFDGAHPLSSAS